MFHGLNRLSLVVCGRNHTVKIRRSTVDLAGGARPPLPLATALTAAAQKHYHRKELNITTTEHRKCKTEKEKRYIVERTCEKVGFKRVKK